MLMRSAVKFLKTQTLIQILRIRMLSLALKNTPMKRTRKRLIVSKNTQTPLMRSSRDLLAILIAISMGLRQILKIVFLHGWQERLAGMQVRTLTA